jgi:hypothetical protein
VEALLNVNPAASGAAAELVDTLGPEGVEKAAEYIQESSLAARFVAKNGAAGVKALVEADGDVAAAEAALKEVPAVPKQLPPARDLSAGPGLTIELTDEQGRKLAQAERAKKWSDLPGQVRTSLGKRYGYIIQEVTRTIVAGGRAKVVLHYPMVDASLIKKLAQGGGRVVITEGRLKGGALRFDIAEIDFDRKTVEVIDLTPTKKTGHVAKTGSYHAELEKLTGFPVESFDLLFVDEDQLVEELQKAETKK